MGEGEWSERNSSVAGGAYVKVTSQILCLRRDGQQLLETTLASIRLTVLILRCLSFSLEELIYLPAWPR